MASEIKLMWAVLVMIFLTSNSRNCVHGVPQVPCYYIFGDSLADNGNNNARVTLAKADYSPYGIDISNVPTGRFTNGANAVDIIAKLLGFDNYIPPFTTAGVSDILKGLNYASAAAGIRDETGKIGGDVISLNSQLQNHMETIKSINAKLGKISATKYLNKCLYSVGMGSNDYLINYFFPLNHSSTSRLYNLEKYAEALIDQYSKQLKTLYDSGARKIVLFGLVKIGCSPYAIRSFPRNGTSCVENMNNAVKLFNSKLKSLVDQLNVNLASAKFIYVNTDGILTKASSSSSYGFRVLNKACCEVPPIYGVLCIPYTKPCPNRNEYVFWDGFHHTGALNTMIAHRSYHAFDPSDAYPYDISHLIRL